MTECPGDRDHLLERGIPVYVDHPGWMRFTVDRLCRSADAGERFGDDSLLLRLSGSNNIVASVLPWVAEVFSRAVIRTDEIEGILLLPPDRECIGRVRDALWVEADTNKTLGRKREDPEFPIYPAISSVAEIAVTDAAHDWGVNSGARSALCHQGKILSQGPAWTVFSPKGKETKETVWEHSHDAWSRVRVALPPRAAAVSPTFLAFDLCRECRATANSEVCLGAAVLDTAECNVHRKTSAFVTPVFDRKGRCGVMRGTVCLAPVSKRRLRPPRCLEVTEATYFASRKPSPPGLPSWVRKQKSIFRKGLITGRGHVHVWDEQRISLGAGCSLGVLRCVTCGGQYLSDDIYGTPMPGFDEELLGAVGKKGGFAKIPLWDLLEIRDRMVSKWGELPEHFATLIAMIACGDGLREPTEADALTAARQLEDWAGSPKSKRGPPKRLPSKGRSLPPSKLTWTKAVLVVTEYDENTDEDVTREARAEVYGGVVAIFKSVDHLWRVVHLPTNSMLGPYETPLTYDTMKEAKGEVVEEIYDLRRDPQLHAGPAGILEVRT